MLGFANKKAKVVKQSPNASLALCLYGTHLLKCIKGGFRLEGALSLCLSLWTKHREVEEIGESFNEATVCD